MPGYIETQIAVRQQRLAALESERAKIIAELAAYQDVLSKAGSLEIPSTVTETFPQELQVSRDWRCILERLTTFKHFNAKDIVLVARDLYRSDVLKKEQNLDSARAQLSLLTKKAILKRVGGGSYRLAEATRSVLESK